MPLRTMRQTEPLAVPDWYVETLTEHFLTLVRYAFEERFLRVTLQRGSEDAGYFDTTPTIQGRDPFVTIAFAEQVGVVTNDVVFSSILAHELGHHESWLLGDSSDALENLLATRPRAIYDEPETLSREIKDEVFALEERAWRYGREILIRIHGFPLDRYERLKIDKLAGYRGKLLC